MAKISRQHFGPSLKEAPLGSRPTALILSPGGALGSWQGGVLYALVKKHEFSFHSVLGASAGTLNGVAYFQDSLQLLREMWLDVPRRSFMSFTPRLRPPGLFSQQAMRRYLESYVDAARCRKLGRCWFYPLAVDIGNGGLAQAEYSPEPGGPWDEPLVDHILGSIAVPFLFPPVRVAGRGGAGDKALVDGAVMSFANLMPLVERGARDFLFVNVLHSRAWKGPVFNPRSLITALINQMMIGLVSQSLSPLTCIAREKGLRAFEINPTEPLNIGVFSFKKDECRRGFELGEKDAAARLQDPEALRIF